MYLLPLGIHQLPIVGEALRGLGSATGRAAGARAVGDSVVVWFLRDLSPGGK